MNTYLLLITALTAQETLFAHYSIFQAREAGISWILIHIIWVIITIFHLVVPYLFAKFLLKNIKSPKLKNAILKIDKKIDLSKNIHNNIFLILLGIVNYIYINSFVAGLLNIKSKAVFIYIFFGDLIWYLLVVSASFNRVNILRNYQTFAGALFITILFSLVLKMASQKILKPK